MNNSPAFPSRSRITKSALVNCGNNVPPSNKLSNNNRCSWNQLRSLPRASCQVLAHSQTHQACLWAPWQPISPTTARCLARTFLPSSPVLFSMHPLRLVLRPLIRQVRLRRHRTTASLVPHSAIRFLFSTQTSFTVTARSPTNPRGAASTAPSS